MSYHWVKNFWPNDMTSCSNLCNRRLPCLIRSFSFYLTEHLWHKWVDVFTRRMNKFIKKTYFKHDGDVNSQVRSLSKSSFCLIKEQNSFSQSWDWLRAAACLLVYAATWWRTKAKLHRGRGASPPLHSWDKSNKPAKNKISNPLVFKIPSEKMPKRNQFSMTFLVFLGFWAQKPNNARKSHQKKNWYLFCIYWIEFWRWGLIIVLLPATIWQVLNM